MNFPTFSFFLQHIQSQIPTLSTFISALMYLVGTVFIFRGVIALKQYGQSGANASQGGLKPALIYLSVGAGLIFYPSMINTSLNTIFGSNNIIAYTNNEGLTNQSKLILQTVELLLRLIGYVAFFRGWVLMTQLAGQQSQPGTLGRALSHIFGGIFLINVYATWQIVVTFLGFGASSV